ncbi:MAG: DNA repair protein RecN [Myxococcaceae bacterium]|nr:DNA repair protein RecN [Myxococcaceae bacterium]
MIRSLRVRNFGVIEEIEVELGPGLTVVTGETGAGKSMLLDALLLLAGGRADSTMLRAGCDEASVEGVFALSAGLGTRLEESGLGSVGDEVLVRRTISAQGRGRAWVNGCLVTVSVLQQVMRGFVDIAGQLEHASLYDEDNHRALVDRFGGLDAEEGPRAAYARRFDERRQVLAQLAELGGDEREARSRVEFLRFQVKELDAAAIKPGEEGQLEATRRRLAGAARLQSLATAADDVLSSRDGSASDLLQEACQRVAEMEKIDAQVGAVRERLTAAIAELDEGCRTLSRYLSAIDHDPAQLRELEERLDLSRTLARKHGVSSDSLAARRDELARELDQLERRGELRGEVERALGAADEALARDAAALSSARHTAARALERRISECLGRLALKNARFSVELAPAAPGPSGADQVRFLFSANPGEPPRPLERIASGGEASRVMLAIKAVLASTERVTVSVLDEVDTGVGGAVADVVGRLIRDVSAHRQVLCITHLPQVAAHANRHLRIEKRLSQGRVHSSVEVLGSVEARSEELARMLSGAEVSREARAAAQVLLAGAARAEAPRPGRGKRHVRTAAERRTA